MDLYTLTRLYISRLVVEWVIIIKYILFYVIIYSFGKFLEGVFSFGVVLDVMIIYLDVIVYFFVVKLVWKLEKWKKRNESIYIQ